LYFTEGFELLLESFTDDLLPIADYFEDTYIGRRGRRNRRAAMFPPSIWNMHSRRGLPRTNNAVEAWHASFQGSIMCAHPTVWKLIDALRKENDLQETVLAQVIGGRNPIRRKKHYERVNKAIDNLCGKCDELPVLDFLRGISHNLEMHI